MFYHDHAFGITRLNVYAGEAAGYLITDAVEAGPDQRHERDRRQSGPAEDPARSSAFPWSSRTRPSSMPPTIDAQDPTWNWGSTPGTPVTGDLWMPHVYMPNQNPYDLERHERLRPVALRPLVLAADDRYRLRPRPESLLRPAQRALGDRRTMPARPIRPWPWRRSWTRRSSTARSILTSKWSRRLYRFRVLNACNDRFVNLQLYKADPAIITADGRKFNTEVRMVPASETAGLPAPVAEGRPRGRRPRPGHDGTVLHPDRHGGRLPARSGTSSTTSRSTGT